MIESSANNGNSERQAWRFKTHSDRHEHIHTMCPRKKSTPGSKEKGGGEAVGRVASRSEPGFVDEAFAIAQASKRRSNNRAIQI